MKQANFSGIKAVVFDVFGTLVEIGDKRRSFAKLMKLIQDAGRSARPDDAQKIMSNNVGLVDAAKMFDGKLSPSVIASLQADLEAELSSIRAFPEASSTLIALRDAGFKIGICSNLAAPYAPPVKKILPFDLDAYVWSFDVGVVKPEPLIYKKICADLGCLPHEVVMIGDTLEMDYTGPNSFGMHGFFLDRRGGNLLVDERLRTLDAILPKLGL